MKAKTTMCFVLLILGAMTTAAGFVYAQEGAIRPVTLGQPMPEFTLPQFQGGELSLSQLKGKNVMILFPRGLAGEDHWCHICNYQYAELLELEEEKQIRQTYNLEILYIFPYSTELVANWIDTFPEQMTDIENWKHPEDPESLDERGKRRMAFATQAFPKQFVFEKGKVPTPFPILLDEERTVSKGLGMFTEDWGGSKIDQNVPTVFLLDEEGIVRFKYFSQNTFDRPGFNYLLTFLSTMMGK